MLLIPLLHRIKVGGVMHEGVVTCSAADDLDRVSRGLAHLVVVAEDRPVGVISTLDIARATRNGSITASGTARWRPPTRPILRSQPRP